MSEASMSKEDCDHIFGDGQDTTPWVELDAEVLPLSIVAVTIPVAGTDEDAEDLIFEAVDREMQNISTTLQDTVPGLIKVEKRLRNLFGSSEPMSDDARSLIDTAIRDLTKLNDQLWRLDREVRP
jgi:hypothetical protein